MNRHIRLLFRLAALLVLLLAAISKPAGADGIAIQIEWWPDRDLEMPAQMAILVYDEQNQREDLILSVELRGGPEAAWVVPVPSLPEVETASPEWFEQLSDKTKPKIEYRVKEIYRSVGEPMIIGEKVAVEVEVISREKVGVYDVSILSADKPGALVDWLNENSYAYPEEGEPLLDTYMAESGWHFVAARVLPEESEQLNGDVHPLWFSFNTEQPIYPMRLTTLLKSPLHVLLYVLADHRMEIPTHVFEPEFAGEVRLGSMSGASAEEIELLTERRYYVTKLRNERLWPSSKDVYFEQSASDEPYQKVVYETEYRTVYVTDTVGPSSGSERSEALQGGEWTMLGLGLALLGVLAGLALVRRQRSRSKPGEEP
jgi:hypothetical protein